MSLRISEWAKLPASLSELCLATTLRCGQSFRWKQLEDKTWTCTLRGRIVQLDQTDSHVLYRSIWPAEKIEPLTPPSSIPPEDADDTEFLLHHYLNLEPDLASLYEQWSKADKNFKKKAPKFTGVRILRQDAFEALVGFICSSNNNIIRISQMVEKLCLHYGRRIGDWQGRTYHDFPAQDALVGEGVEAHLRQLGFGYRAKYLVRTAQILCEEREKGWLESLHNPEKPAYGQTPTPGDAMLPEGRPGYRNAHEQLLALQGVGPKVADCVCLMGLGWGDAVPVDTHVWQIAQRDYRIGKGKHSSLTKATYDVVANHFRKLWGQEAGWAHSVLFAADLKVFAERLQEKVIREEALPPGHVKVESVKIIKHEADELADIKIESTKLVKKEEQDAAHFRLETIDVVSQVAVKREQAKGGRRKRVLQVDEVSVKTSPSKRTRRR